MLFNVCSAVTVESCVTRVAWVRVVCLLLCKDYARRDKVLYEMPLSFLGCGMGTRLANFHMCGIMVLLRTVLNMLVMNASPRGTMCFRCLMISLSRPCELLSVQQDHEWIFLMRG